MLNTVVNLEQTQESVDVSLESSYLDLFVTEETLDLSQSFDCLDLDFTNQTFTGLKFDIVVLKQLCLVSMLNQYNSANVRLSIRSSDVYQEGH